MVSNDENGSYRATLSPLFGQFQRDIQHCLKDLGVYPFKDIRDVFRCQDFKLSIDIDDEHAVYISELGNSCETNQLIPPPEETGGDSLRYGDLYLTQSRYAYSGNIDNFLEIF